MSVRLIFTTKVQINIWNFISFKSRNVSKGISCPSLINSLPQVGHFYLVNRIQIQPNHHQRTHLSYNVNKCSGGSGLTSVISVIVATKLEPTEPRDQLNNHHLAISSPNVEI